MGKKNGFFDKNKAIIVCQLVKSQVVTSGFLVIQHGFYLTFQQK
ncbi:hypothetical protein C8D91_0658 [Marinicella litoralis]|uniref:Uncharacterized protein n=1 Tax=Marinicella litoralis TaxID=644220 RepID=A0A4R6XUV5_9GAMM|nr:hypothetical protein C8D91_0658 [Marinicella litoralis]